MARAGRKRTFSKREPNGRTLRDTSRDGLIASGKMVHEQFAVYFGYLDGKTKVGFSGSLNLRMIALQHDYGDVVRVAGLVYAPTREIARTLEATLHRKLKAEGKHIDGEWFELGREDVAGLLSDCRRIGLKTFGGEDASADAYFPAGMAAVVDSENAPSTIHEGW